MSSMISGCGRSRPDRRRWSPVRRAIARSGEHLFVDGHGAGEVSEFERFPRLFEAEKDAAAGGSRRRRGRAGDPGLRTGSPGSGLGGRSFFAAGAGAAAGAGRAVGGFGRNRSNNPMNDEENATAGTGEAKSVPSGGLEFPPG